MFCINSTKDRGQTKNHRDSMVEVIAISNRCELLTLEIYFLESVWSSVGLRQKAQSNTAIISTMKISLWFVV